MKSKKPSRNFPLFAHPGGQWCKKLKGRFYYFGSIRSDPKGEAALRDWLARKDGIETGLDKLRVETVAEGMTLGELMARFLQDRRASMMDGELSPRTYSDYLAEIQRFIGVVGKDGKVCAMTPDHFRAYAATMTKRKLGRHARRRTIAYIKAMLNWGAGNGYYAAPTYGNDFTAPDVSPDAIRQAKARAGEKDYTRRIVTGTELDKLITAARPLFKAIILMSVNCGLGPADLGRMKWRHINMDTGEFDMPRGKTGAERKGYLWKRTRKALKRVATLKYNRLAIEKDGAEALVFLSRKNQPMYRETEIIEDGISVGVEIANPITLTFGRLVKLVKLEGVTQYRLRHTFKTLGKRAKDRDALNLMMGHRERSTGAVYDHEEIDAKRIRRVSMTVLRSLWPRPRLEAAKRIGRPMMRLAV